MVTPLTLHELKGSEPFKCEGGSLIATYTYNYQGQRTRKVTSNGTTVYHYDLNGSLISETDEAGNPIRDVIYRDTVPVAQIDAGTTEVLTYLHSDHLGTPRRGTNENGVVVWSWNSDAFGSTEANDDPDGDGVATLVNLRFPGQYYDAETALHYNYFRYYDPATGRYITSDPIGLNGGLNTYGYVYQNPVRYTDSKGLQVTIDIVNTGSTGNSISGTITTTSDLVSVAASSNQIQDAQAGSCECKKPISDGSYPAFVRTDGGRTRIELTGTVSQGLTNIQIHPANAPNVNGEELLDGCIAPGTAGNTPDWVSNSQNAMDAIMNVINADGSGDIVVNITTQNNGITSP